MADSNMPDIRMDADNLYRDEVFTDLKVGSVRRMTPVTPDGEVDPGRETIYHGQTSLQSPAGQIPLNFELKGNSLSEAVAAFSEAAQAEAERMMQELEELQRQQQAQQGGQSGQGGQQGGRDGDSRIQLL